MGKLNEEVVLEQIRLLGGNISAIARTCGVDRSGIIGFIEKRPHLRKAVREARAGEVDEARLSLARQVADGKSWAVKLALKSAAPDAFDREDADDVPELTDEQRLEMLQKLVESLRAKQEKERPDADKAGEATK